ncbi:Crossover junction endodeoxyribonuclease RuvC [bioreactor metagenome]|uniref:Crossover junction endodeoxyribonuclease RuvC n=1 Tax=bioreactor metagenome TaxID=1076179 RepID=A0A644Y601_9ZZZZ
MVILGIDPGFATVGFALLSSQQGKAELLRCGAVTTPAGLPMPLRLLQIEEDLEALIETFSPKVLAVEELYFGSNVTTGIGVAQARGVILMTAAKMGLSVFEYSPSQVKQAVVGYGRAEKRQVMEMTKRLLGLAALPKPDDAADAIAIALCHARSSTSLLTAGV